MPDFHLTPPSSSLAASFHKITPEDFVNLTQDPAVKTFFSRADIEELMDQPESTGLRIYPCFAFGTTTDFSLLAVAISFMNNITSEDESNKCFIAVENKDDQRMPMPAKRVTKRSASDRVRKFNGYLGNPNKDQREPPLSLLSTKVSIGERNYAKVSFSSSTIRTLLSDKNTIGIRFYSVKTPIQDVYYPTLAAVAVQDTGDDIASSVTLDGLPCPPDCGGGVYL